jgi:dUTP pyrophosphatase
MEVMQTMIRVRGFEPVSGYENVAKEPQRKTKYSAGYDLHAAKDTIIQPIWKGVARVISCLLGVGIHRNLTIEDIKDAIKPTLVETGIKAYMPNDEYIHCVSRSSGPIKRGLVMSNGAGIIDADYYNSPETEGHIKMQFYNFGVTPYTIQQGEAVGQAVFHKYLIADYDSPGGDRVGGFGSTDN